ncbi:RagB/SusD family nutrient uptake outer membrane protein [Chitinophaga sp. MM2321]|uniref:RagB/SusD family nutrient uptake outer membrane protein n=1 Tax=Chitinophaga sp. MM2321 TaxID=3137178 RepID=UPI0032D5A732
MKAFINYILLVVCITTFQACTNLDEVWYDKVVPETFFKSEADIKAALYRPFTHARWYVVNDRWRAQELTADQFAVTTKGPHWYDGGAFERYHYHKWTMEDGWIWETWRGTLMGIALALDTKQDLNKLDYGQFKLTQADKDAHVNQLNTLIGYFYMRGLDFFGGLPVFDSLNEENLPRNTDVETFDHVEQLFKGAIDKLPVKAAGEAEEGAIRQAAAVAMLAELYFNAEAYIRKPMYAECAKLCEEIIAGKYGSYQLDASWNGAFNFTNDKSPEIIWSMPSQFNKLQYDWFYGDFYHYNSRVYFGVDMGASNGIHLQPSRRPDSTLYKTAFKLGSPYEKFNDKDLRKHPYVYTGSGNYTGMFLTGKQISPVTGDNCVGTQEYKDKLLVLDDRVGRFSEVGPGKKYASVSQLPSKISEGEENTGVRLVKVPIPPDSEKSLRWGADQPVIRLTEIYYMLAECKWRSGDHNGAANLINQVRKRNFENGLDPDPATAANLDEYRMLDEWGIEFLGEGRRRTDLIRWNKFVTEPWWDHQPGNNKFLNRFPVPLQAISGNNNLQQNEGY